MDKSLFLEERLAQREKEHLTRVRRVIDGAQQPSLTCDGKRVIAFCSNDYLGLANHPQVKEAFKKGVDRYGVGSGASHLVVGHHRVHHQLEEALAEFTGRDRALLFSSGYMANLAVVTTLLNKSAFIFEDKLNHASLIDAGLLSGARFQRYLHNDVDSLSKKLADKKKDDHKLIATDAVFSMDGDIAQLGELSALAKQHQAWLMVDDAHGFGVLGKNGAGSLSEYELTQSDVPILMATLGKACGVMGAFVAGSHTLIESLVQFARTYIYTTALPPAVAEATLGSLRIIKTDDVRRAHLRDLILYFKKSADELNLPLNESMTAIQPLLIGDSQKALLISAALEEKGFLVTPIRPPTVPANTARLRITLSAVHTREQVNQLLEALSAVCKQYE